MGLGVQGRFCPVFVGWIRRLRQQLISPMTTQLGSIDFQDGSFFGRFLYHRFNYDCLYKD